MDFIIHFLCAAGGACLGVYVAAKLLRKKN
jgi:hypothetical protein